MNNLSISTHTQNINEEIEITALTFRPSRQTKRDLEGFPRRMVWGGREYTFIDDGLEYLIQKGKHLIKLFDVSDGLANYRLRFDPEEHRWTLLSIKDTPLVSY